MAVECDKAAVERVLERVLELVGDDSTWTSEVMARDRAGEPVDALAVEAVSFCLHGAIKSAVWEQYELPLGVSMGVIHEETWSSWLWAIKLVSESCKQIFIHPCIDAVNDDLGREAALLLVKDALHRLTEEADGA